MSAHSDAINDAPEPGTVNGYRWRPTRFKPDAIGFWYGVYIADNGDYDVILVKRWHLEDATDER